MNKILTLFAILLCSLAGTFPAVARAQQEKNPLFAERLQIGEKAPAIAVASWLTKPEEGITEFKPGHIYVIDFWGTWCGACIGEMPELAEIQKEFADRKVTIISVTDEKLDEVNAFLDQPCHHNDKVTYRELTSAYRIAADPDGSVFDDYMKGIQRRSFPMMAVIGKTGLIEYIGSTMGLRPTLESIVADKWDRESSRLRQYANWKAKETMLKVNDLRVDGKIDEAIELLNQQFEQADLALRTFSYRMELKMRPDESGAQSKERFEAAHRRAAIECARWERNRFGFLLSQRSSEAVEPFRKIFAAYEGSPIDQINFAWRVYIEQDRGTEVDPKLIITARDAAKAVSDKSPENAVYLDVYAHLQHAAGETEAAIETFKLALEKTTDENRAEVQGDYQELLKSIGK